MLSLISASLAFAPRAAPSGSYCGSVPVILDDKITFNGDGTADFHINIKIAKQVVDCKAEKVTVTDADVHFTNIAQKGDCMGDALTSQGKDPSKWRIPTPEPSPLRSAIRLFVPCPTDRHLTRAGTSSTSTPTARSPSTRTATPTSR